MNKWITSKQFRQKYNITPQHFYELKKHNKIETKPYIGRQVLVKDVLDETNTDNNNSVAIYARVSTNKQIKDLENQIDYLTKYAVSNGYKVEYVFKDIASGINENRKGLNDLLNLVFNNQISKIIISHKDRLTRFGFDYFKNICEYFGTEIEIVNLESDKSFKEELSEDLIAIIQQFSMKFHGKIKRNCKLLEEKLIESENSLDK